jgi:hypothetical protein
MILVYSNVENRKIIDVYQNNIKKEFFLPGRISMYTNLYLIINYENFYTLFFSFHHKFLSAGFGLSHGPI